MKRGGARLLGMMTLVVTKAAQKAARKAARQAARQARLVARLTRAYDRACRAEENAATEAKAWRRAKVSERCLRDLRAAQAGLPLPSRQLPPTLRNRAKLALGFLGALGRSIARAIQCAAALHKAQAVNAAKRVARQVARLARAAMRRALLAIVARLPKFAVTVALAPAVVAALVPTVTVVPVALVPVALVPVAATTTSVERQALRAALRFVASRLTLTLTQGAVL
jgi:hypothetical protein